MVERVERSGNRQQPRSGNPTHGGTIDAPIPEPVTRKSVTGRRPSGWRGPAAVVGSVEWKVD
jgi:hypothetical protein